MSDNKHPADELAEIRLMVREWKEREEELRLLILDMPEAEREGKKYIATVTEAASQKLNVHALREEFGDISKFYEPSFFTTVRTKRKK